MRGERNVPHVPQAFPASGEELSRLGQRGEARFEQRVHRFDVSREIPKFVLEVDEGVPNNLMKRYMDIANCIEIYIYI